VGKSVYCLSPKLNYSSNSVQPRGFESHPCQIIEYFLVSVSLGKSSIMHGPQLENQQGGPGQHYVEKLHRFPPEYELFKTTWNLSSRHYTYLPVYNRFTFCELGSEETIPDDCAGFRLSVFRIGLCDWRRSRGYLMRDFY
jgi:hypothetical protein